MIARFINTTLQFVFLFGFAGMLFSQDKLIAFPTAEGGGKFTTGGRGGSVYEVTTTSGSGEGSFGSALSKPGPRTIVFRVSGNIKGDFTIPDNTTVAGQTAPGDGICLHGAVFLGNNVIVRYIRVRGQPSTDAIGGRETKGIMLDHVSASFSTDENVSIYHCENVTIQWCIVSEAMGGSHGFAGIWGGGHELPSS